jgi:two-component system, LytTR family, sensor kinase
LGGAFQWNYLIYWLIAGGWLAWDYNRESQDRKLQAAQLELKTTQLEQRLTEARLLNLKAQLHPHFLFNALNTISAFVEKDPRGARQMIEHLGDLLRFSLEHSEDQEMTLAAEIAVLDHYLAIQRVRFEDHLRLRMEIAPDTSPALAWKRSERSSLMMKNPRAAVCASCWKNSPRLSSWRSTRTARRRRH